MSGHDGGLSVSVTEKVAPLVLLSPPSGAMGRVGEQDHTDGALTLLLTLVDPKSHPTVLVLLAHFTDVETEAQRVKVTGQSPRPPTVLSGQGGLADHPTSPHVPGA